MNFLLFGGIAAAILIPLITVFLIAISLRRVVDTNQVHIVQRKNSTTSYGKEQAGGNVYYEWPSWLPLLGLTVSSFPVSVFPVRLDKYEAYDKGRLPFLIDVVAFFRINNSDIAAKSVSNYQELIHQLESILQGAVRTVLAKSDIEHIMEDRSIFGSLFTEEVDGQLKEWGVQTVKSIELMNISDATGSNAISNIMAKKKSLIERESREVVAQNLQIANTKEIEADQAVKLAQQIAQQAVGERTALTEQAVGIAREKATQEVQEAAAVTAEKTAAVQRVEQVQSAEIARSVAEIEANKQKAVTVINAEAAKQQTITNAQAAKEQQIISGEAQKVNQQLVSEGALTAATNEAKGVEAVGLAKAEAEKALLRAPVAAQIELADKIDNSPQYQSYLIQIRRIEADQAIGTEAAKSLASADLKVIANSGDVNTGVTSLLDVLGPKGGQAAAGFLTGLAQTEEGAAVIEAVTKKPKKGA